jgi:hypothetical protein
MQSTVSPPPRSRALARPPPAPFVRWDAGGRFLSYALSPVACCLHIAPTMALQRRAQGELWSRFGREYTSPDGVASHGSFYEKQVTSGNKWGFPPKPLPKPFVPPPPAPRETPARRRPWWSFLCDSRWLVSLLALLLLILLLLTLPERTPPPCPVPDCRGVLGGNAFTDVCGVCNGNNRDLGCDGVCFSGAVRVATFGDCCHPSERGCDGRCFSVSCSCSQPEPTPPEQQQCRPPPQTQETQRWQQSGW